MLPCGAPKPRSELDGTVFVKTERAITRSAGIRYGPKQRFAVFGLHGKFHTCNAERLSEVLQHESFDLVYSFGVIHHTPNQRAVIAEARRTG